MIGGLVRETIALRRAYDCTHAWKPLNAGEDQCSKCAVIATPEGKVNLERMTRAFHGRKGGR